MMLGDLKPSFIDTLVLYIKNFFEINKILVDVDVEENDEGRIFISVSSNNPDFINFANHQVAFSFQHLLRLVSKGITNKFYNIILELGNSREERRQQLEKIVDESIEKIKSGFEFCTLSYLSSYERKIVHDIVSARGYVSKSSGEGSDRRISIMK